MMISNLKKYSIASLEIIALISTTTFILAIFGIIYYHSNKAEKYSQLRDSIIIRASQLQIGLALPLWNLDEAQTFKAIESLMEDPAVYSVEILAFNKKIFRTRPENWEKSKFFIQKRVVRFHGEELGKLTIVYSSRFIDELIYKNAIFYFLFILILDVFLVFGLYLIHRYIVLKPLMLIEKYAEKVSSGQNETVDKSVVFPAELNNLLGSIEKMVNQLEIRYIETKKAKDAAEVADRVKTEFLNIAAHELKTPLTSLLLIAQLAARESLKGIITEKTVFEKIVQQAKRLAELVNDILDVTKLESGGSSLQLQKVNPNTLVDHSLEEYKGRPGGNRFTFSRLNQPIKIEVDPRKIQQVLLNFMDNAINYTPSDSPVEIKIELINDAKIRFSVTDHGLGIAPENLSSLFGRFYRVKSDLTIQHTGLGLGLYICRHIIKLHKGQINVDSKVGEGSKFYFDLPLKNTELPEEQALS